jgi:hydroxyquinol 1,2-dioxygenase
MPIQNEADVTEAVLRELARTDDPRLREVMGSAVRHLHAFAREVRLTEPEFQAACAVIAEIGRRTTPSHNEAVLMAGSLGMSTLVCLLNNGDGGTKATTANLLGPFWRDSAPAVENGGSIVRSPTPGIPMFVDAWVKDREGRPVAGARVDVWNASADGFYENQDPSQADWNLRGTLTTDDEGHAWFRGIKPSGYPVPVDGPTGNWLRAQGRHNMRPAHIHFLISKEGFKTQFSQVYDAGDPNLETDSQFGVTAPLVAAYVLHENEPAPAPDVSGPWYSLSQIFIVDPGVSRLPRAPITGKAQGARPERKVLKRS